jgi:hypothetical protein
MLQSLAYFSKSRVSHMSKIDFSKVFAAGLRAISRLIIAFPSIEQKIFIKSLRRSIAHTAQELHPDKPISYLAHKTGLLSEQINDELDRDYPVPVMDTESIILSDLWRHRDSNGKVPINGKDITSFYTIAMNQLKGRHSLSSVLDSLIKSGSVKRDGDQLVVLSNSFTINQDEEKVINQTGLIMNRLVDTVIYNKNTSIYDRLYQQTYKTTKVAPRDRKNMHNAIHKVLENLAMPEVIKIIDEHERDVPNGYYPECGISMFEFDEVNNNEGEK